jgi:hypothetical protein
MGGCAMRKPATVDNIKAGDLVSCHGFTCIPDHAVRKVEMFPDQGLFIKCSSGSHFLEGQLDKEGKYVGLEKIYRAKDRE